MTICPTITRLNDSAELVRRRAYGVIEACDGAFTRLVLRPWPKMISLPEVWLFGRWRHRSQAGDRIRLYYNQPWGHRNYLVLKYAESTHGTTFATLSRALAVLDEIARIKGSDALLCEATNARITAGAARRWGWEPHCPTSRRRHFIKRFYGVYPPRPEWLVRLLSAVPV